MHRVLQENDMVAKTIKSSFVSVECVLCNVLGFQILKSNSEYSHEGVIWVL